MRDQEEVERKKKLGKLSGEPPSNQIDYLMTQEQYQELYNESYIKDADIMLLQLR